MNWKAPAVLLIGLFLLGGIVTAAPVDKPEAVPLATVKALAVRELHKFPEFNGAVPTNPTPLYFPDGRLAAYEFRMVKNGKTIGYIIVSANRNLPPAILEAGFGEKTPSDLMKELAVRKGAKNYRFAYLGGLSYGLLIGDKLMDIKGREYKKPSRYTLSLEVEATKNQKEWKSIESIVLTTPKYPITPLATITSEKIIYGVPAWTDTDPGGASDTDSNLGPAPDPWGDDDACAPIAGSMVVGYYEPQYRTDWYREAIIDILHDLMHTDYCGNTAPDDIGPGLEAFYQDAIRRYWEGELADPPHCSYQVYWYENPDPSWLFGKLKYEVDNNRPGLFRTFQAYLEESGKWITWPHVMSFTGYRIYSNGYEYLQVHTGARNYEALSVDWILVGNWQNADLYVIYPTCISGPEPLSGGDTVER
ncbi:hypothetical protein E3E26_00535 [Thermococcus sp. LS1]|uniref:nuclear transport factor 2 family protein n=1 Tax=Thermococcus sp. LS1 TaxID=1638259 RepID=UPI0014395248|nr:nuclear transport factor 2 family protein [Thermococcus sp. LS1]NJD98295.1 hypothetical protein [Thermococcus sp. LS1]